MPATSLDSIHAYRVMLEVGSTRSQTDQVNMFKLRLIHECPARSKNGYLPKEPLGRRNRFNRSPAIGVTPFAAKEECPGK